MSQPETNRLVTFETATSELLAIQAGTAEIDRRTIYRGNVEGRYAVVPVDELVGTDGGQTVDDLDMQIEEMQIVGDTVNVADHGDATVSVAIDGELVARMDQRGTYGLLWIPSV